VFIKIKINAKNQYLNIFKVITLYVSDNSRVIPFIIEKHNTAEIINKIPFIFFVNNKIKQPIR
jgi:hypothetical protein